MSDCWKSVDSVGMILRYLGWFICFLLCARLIPTVQWYYRQHHVQLNVPLKYYEVLVNCWWSISNVLVGVGGVSMKCWWSVNVTVSKGSDDCRPLWRADVGVWWGVLHSVSEPISPLSWLVASSSEGQEMGRSGVSRWLLTTTTTTTFRYIHCCFDSILFGALEIFWIWYERYFVLFTIVAMWTTLCIIHYCCNANNTLCYSLLLQCEQHFVLFTILSTLECYHAAWGSLWTSMCVSP